MTVALIGIYYKTQEDATEAYKKLPEWQRQNSSIVEFDNAFLIVSDEQLKALQKMTMKINKRKIRVFRRRHPNLIKRIAWAVLIIGLLLNFLGRVAEPTNEPEIISPIPENTLTPTTNIEKIVPTTSPNPPQRPTTGKASYYSVSGCLGCRDDRVMANGERLDDTRVTLAYNHAPLNTWVRVTNIITGQNIRALVTDRGGFERHGKIADLSVATKEAIGCGDVCQIALEF